jgi:ribosomal-protein-alanine N-acetyltransferase
MIKNQEIHIETDRFIIRRLTIDDATPQYLSWLDEQSRQGFIVSAKEKISIQQLREYIDDRFCRNDVIFFGIFTKDQKSHIGNIKFEPVNYLLKYAVMGILIGEPRWRGLGVAPEVIVASARWLNAQFDISQIILGVGINNTPAIKSYQKSGFAIEKTDKISVDETQAISMIMHLNKSH